MASSFVIISFYADSSAHETWVRNLGKDLTQAGVDVRLRPIDLRLKGKDIISLIDSRYKGQWLLIVCSDQYIKSLQSSDRSISKRDLLLGSIVPRSSEGDMQTLRNCILLMHDCSDQNPASSPIGLLPCVDFRQDASYQRNFAKLLKNIGVDPQSSDLSSTNRYQRRFRFAKIPTASAPERQVNESKPDTDYPPPPPPPPQALEEPGSYEQPTPSKNAPSSDSGDPYQAMPPGHRLPKRVDILTSTSTASIVDAAVYCPAHVPPSSTFLLQVWLYTPDEAQRVAKEAVKMDETAEKRGSFSFPLDVPVNTEVSLQLEVDPLLVEEPYAKLLWRGRACPVQFELTVPAAPSAEKVIGRVRFSIDDAPVGTLRFQIQITDCSIPAAALSFDEIDQHANRYRSAFVSYSSKDRPEVVRLVRAFDVAGLSTFMDVLNLDAGERWEKELYRQMDQCDVFILCWSRSAATSEWVNKEIDYALSLNHGIEDKPPEIRPYLVEVPPLAPPPTKLGYLHFNDRFWPHLVIAEMQKQDAENNTDDRSD
jgi:hypothetical protein